MKKALTLALFLLSACGGVRSVQVQPPILSPPGLITGYGVEKIAGNPVRARQAAYLKAMDDLLTHTGPVLVSKTVHDQTTVVDVKPANRSSKSRRWGAATSSSSSTASSRSISRGETTPARPLQQQ